jgi:hypothetical protein
METNESSGGYAVTLAVSACGSQLACGRFLRHAQTLETTEELRVRSTNRMRVEHDWQRQKREDIT